MVIGMVGPEGVPLPMTEADEANTLVTIPPFLNPPTNLDNPATLLNPAQLRPPPLIALVPQLGFLLRPSFISSIRYVQHCLSLSKSQTNFSLKSWNSLLLLLEAWKTLMTA